MLAAWDAAAAGWDGNGALIRAWLGAATAAMLDAYLSPGLPTTVLIDRDGNEIGRLLGPAHWSGTDAVTLIRAALAETKSGGA